MTQVVIVGNGVTGITAARFLRKLRPEADITVISAESERFFSRPGLMYVFLGHLRFRDLEPYEPRFWETNRITLRQHYVTRIDTAGKRLLTGDGQRVPYDRLLLATGSISAAYGWPGEDLPGVQGFVTKQDLELLETNVRGVRRAVIVGGGLIGIEAAEMLRSRGIEVTFLVREERYMDYLFAPEESDLIEREIRDHGVDLRLGAHLDRFVAGPGGRAAGVVTMAGEEIPCGLVVVTAGVAPNLHVTAGSSIKTANGILVNRTFETNVEDVYAAGDCAEFTDPLPGRPAIEQLWYTGRLHGETVARNLSGERTPYVPGVFFNSAKFFSIEYQTYGNVPPSVSSENDSLFWREQAGKRALRIVYRKVDGAVTGLNAFGLRLRQDLCTRWIQDSAPIEAVVSDLAEARFDAELTRRFEREAVRQWLPMMSR